jgi:Holliday junction resolvase RusA-like endonuclease
MREINVEMPIQVEIGVKKKRKYFLNLNLYRNNHMHVNNNIKREYARIAHGVLPNWKTPMENIEIEYTLYLPDKRKRDISNVLSVVDKAFCDSLTTHGLIPDDNYQHLKKVTYMYGGMDEKGKGYVKIKVKEVKDE